jgi:predicted nucleic acid-binding Zn ribbon protein
MTMKKKRSSPSPEVLAKGKVALEAYRKEAAEAKAKGGKFYAEWLEEQALKKERKRVSPQQAIRNFCNNCVGGIREDITNCTAKQCSLYMYRPYQRGEV